MNKSIRNLIKSKMVFLKYILSSLTCALIDLLFFIISKNILKNFLIKYLFLSTIIARVFSSFINYIFNKNFVFDNKFKVTIDKNTAIKYYILVIIQMFLSAFILEFICSYIKGFEVLIKLIIDLILFVLSFLVQKLIIFRK